MASQNANKIILAGMRYNAPKCIANSEAKVSATVVKAREISDLTASR
jgi:hypothetical protein